METTQTTRSEHMAWCKRRAHEYLPHDPMQAAQSMVSDLGKHPDTQVSVQMAAAMMIGLDVTANAAACARWIDGFN